VVDFSPWPRRSPFGDAAGPLLFREDAGGLTFGLRIAEKHTNSRGTAHGGVLSTVADNTLGYAAALSTDPPTPLQTVSLSIDFITPAQVGDLVTITPEVLRVGSRLAHARGELMVDEQVVARASAALAVIRS
jgi:acyl-coenzyme A thioesterase 13